MHSQFLGSSDCLAMPISALQYSPDPSNHSLWPLPARDFGSFASNPSVFLGPGGKTAACCCIFGTEKIHYGTKCCVLCGPWLCMQVWPTHFDLSIHPPTNKDQGKFNPEKLVYYHFPLSPFPLFEYLFKLWTLPSLPIWDDVARLVALHAPFSKT